MMQEDELVIKDNATLANIDVHVRGGREVQPFTVSGMLSNLQNTDYQYSRYEIFVTLVVMLSTISGGFLEGYTSPAIPSLLIDPNSGHFESSNQNFTLELDRNGSFLNYTTILPYTNNPHLNNDSTFIITDMQSQSSNKSIVIDDQQSTMASLIDEYVTTLAIEEITVTTSSQESEINDELLTETNTSVLEINKTIPSEKEHHLNESATLIDSKISTTVIASEIPITLRSVEDQENNLTTSTGRPNRALMKRNVDAASFVSISENTSTIAELPETKSLKISEEEASWLGSLLLLGACLGAAISSWIVSLGRRHAIIFSALPRISGWVLIAASSSVSTLYMGRFLSGFSLGMVSTAAPIYISEVSHPSLRGSLNCVVQLGVNIGIFLAALFGTFMEWQSLAIMGAVFVVFYFILSMMIPNSPSWLISSNKEVEARDVLKKLRGNAFSIEEELQQIITLAEKNKKQDAIAWKDLFLQRRCRMPLTVVILVTLVNRFSGYNAIITYCVTFLHDAVPNVSEYAAAAVICFVQIIATGFSITVVDKWGRRKLLLLSVCLMALSLLVISFCKGVFATSEGAAWITVLATMFFVGSYSLGVGPLTWVLLGELFPMDARDKASALVSVLNWLLAFLITKIFFTMEAALGVGGTCLFYASVCVVGAICFYFFVPETKGRTLAEIEAHFTYSQLSWRNLAPKVDRAMSSILDQDMAATIDTYSTFQ